MKSSKKGGDFWTVKLAWKQTGCLLCFHFIILSVFKSTILGSAQISGHTCVPAVSSSVCWEQLTQWFSCRSKKYFKSFIFWQPGTCPPHPPCPHSPPFLCQFYSHHGKPHYLSQLHSTDRRTQVSVSTTTEGLEWSDVGGRPQVWNQAKWRALCIFQLSFYFLLLLLCR